MEKNVECNVVIVDVSGNDYVMMREVVRVTCLLRLGIVASDGGGFDEYDWLIR